MMNTTTITASSSAAAETLATAWTVDWDERFFRIVARLFSPEFLYGASVLLMTNDE